jgi:hypothetical protein
MLSVALLVFSARMQPRVIEKRVEVAQTAASPVDVNAAVAKAVSVAMAEQEKKTRVLLEAADRKHQMEEKQLAFRVAEYVTNLEKTMGTNSKLQVVSYSAERPQQ